jgi:hypothetical protein
LVTRELARLAGYDLLPMAIADGTLNPLSDHCQHAILMSKATAVALAMDEDDIRTTDELAEYVAALSVARDYLQDMINKARAEQATSNVSSLRAAS